MWSWWWLALASSLFLWLLVLAVHPGRSIRRFLIPVIIAGLLFIPCAPICGFGIWYSARQWRTSYELKKLLSSKPRMILYSIDADHLRPMEVKKGYRRLGVDEIILPSDFFNNAAEFARMDQLPDSVLPFTDPTVNSIADQNVKSGYGKGWQILRKETEGSNEPEPEATPAPDSTEFDREPYKGPAVLGYAEITDSTEQHALITALADSARHSRGGALCHNPRHGLYLETDTSVINLSICFECENVYLSGPEDKMGYFRRAISFDITRAPESVFNATLKQHGVTTAKDLR
jgi:hypothetical protein